MNTATEFGIVFSRLCHVVTLTQDGKLEAAIESIVINIFASNVNLAPATVAEIRESISQYFGVQLSEREIQEALDTHVAGANMQFQDGAYTINPHISTQYQQRIEDANDLEREVKHEWFGEIKDLDFAKLDNWKQSMWDCLTSYMARAFYQHGAQTIRLLDPNTPTSADDTVSLQSYANEARKLHCKEIPMHTVTQAIQRFFTSRKAARTKYVSQLLDATFTYFALTTDDVVARYLTETIPSVKIFMDTNFIFGLLDLHDNPLNEISKELVDCIVANEIPFTFHYTLQTLDEIERTVSFNANRLRGRQWRTQTSRIARNNPHISGIERRFHSLNAQSSISVDHFLSQYEQMATLLNDRGFVKFDEETSLSTDQRHDLLLAYEVYLHENRPDRPKPQGAIKHDVHLLQLAHSARNDTGYGLDVGAFLITADYYLADFERKNPLQKNRAVATVFPNQMFQLLRPFIRTSDAVDSRFVETFALPEFRITEVDYSGTVSKVLSIMNSYPNVSDESAVKILTDNLIIAQFKDLREDPKEFQQLYESEIARENKRLAEQLENTSAESLSEIEELRIEAVKREQKLQEEESESQRKISVLEIDNRARAEEVEALQQEKMHRDALLHAIGFLIGALILVVVLTSTLLSSWFASHTNNIQIAIATIGTILLTSARIAFGHRWKWFDTHSKRNGLQLIAFAICLTIFVWFADPPGVWFGLVSTILSLLISAFGIIDRS